MPLDLLPHSTKTKSKDTVTTSATRRTISTQQSTKTVEQKGRKQGQREAAPLAASGKKLRLQKEIKALEEGLTRHRHLNPEIRDVKRISWYNLQGRKFKYTPRQVRRIHYNQARNSFLRSHATRGIEPLTSGHRRQSVTTTSRADVSSPFVNYYNSFLNFLGSPAYEKFNARRACLEQDS